MFIKQTDKCTESYFWLICSIIVTIEIAKNSPYLKRETILIQFNSISACTTIYSISIQLYIR